MNLRDLAGRSLEEIEPAAETARCLLDGAIRYLQDSRIRAISAETRFVSAYTAIRMLADLGLHAHGSRTRSSVPGHHLIAIQALTATLGVD